MHVYIAQYNFMICVLELWRVSLYWVIKSTILFGMHIKTSAPHLFQIDWKLIDTEQQCSHLENWWQIVEAERVVQLLQYSQENEDLGSMCWHTNAQCGPHASYGSFLSEWSFSLFEVAWLSRSTMDHSYVDFYIPYYCLLLDIQPRAISGTWI